MCVCLHVTYCSNSHLPQIVPTPPDLPLLFPCGSIRKDTLAVKLKSQGFSLTEVVCYETCASADIGQRLTFIVKEKVRMGKLMLEWFVIG